jgi:hypothetical protein
MSSITQENIDQIVNSSFPERLSSEVRPPVSDDHIIHIFRLTQWGQTHLAADHLLFPEINGILSKTVSGLIKQLNILFASSKPFPDETGGLFKKKVHLRQYAYETLLEMVLNFYGLESQWLQKEEKAESLKHILSVLEEWENLERREGEFSIARTVVQKWLDRMKRVQKGNSMVAQTALSIEGELNFEKNFLLSFLKKAETEIKGNIYYHMVKEGKCKFGNDYALGLRWLRHLGFEQVSTNPVLAARAYQDEPSLTETFKEEVKHHPNFKKWSDNPSRYGEEMTLFATLLALWDNLYVFRPIFFNLKETSGGGVVSFQLNPNIAHLFEESIQEVFWAFSLASENLTLYDRYLLAGYRTNGERGRPNMVIKVAATSPVARTITRTIISYGFGSNITLDYSVSQEATLLLEEMEGMAGSVKKGIRPTQIYMTNMGGRLESHLREVKLVELFQDLRKKIGEEKAIEKITCLSESNGTKDKVSQVKTYEDKVAAATRYTHGQKTINEPIDEVLKEVVSKETLQNLEEAIGKSGTLVARRMWEIFFSEKNRRKWIDYLMKKNSLTRDQAQLIMDRIHYLPASKRKPLDTYGTLSSRNLVHTEFPDHQENVRRMAEEPQFALKDYEESISTPFPPDVLIPLNQMEDFRKAYEINPELKNIFQEVGISGDFGLRGLLPEDWAQFGPVQKTLFEFKSAYDHFGREMASILQGLVKKKQPPKKKKVEKREKRKWKKRIR